MPNLFLALTLSPFILLPPTANAAMPVFRCEVGSRVFYADEPCARSAGRTVAVDDARTLPQRAAAIAATQREATFAREARAQRLAEERAVAMQQPAGIRMAVREPDEAKKTPRKRMQAKKPRSAKPMRNSVAVRRA